MSGTGAGDGAADGATGGAATEADAATAAILVVGSTMIDLIAYADVLPEAGQTVVGTRFAMGFGGKGANQAVAAARFGARVALVNAVGEDAYGAQTIENLGAQGVDTTWVRRLPGSSGVAPIWVDGAGMNRIIIVPGTNLEVPVSLALEAVAAVRPGVVVGQFEIPQPVTAAAFAAARREGALTVLNPAPAAPVAPDLLAVTDWLVPNEHELAAIAGRPLAADAVTAEREVGTFAARLGVSVIATLGERGVIVAAIGQPAVLVDAPAVAAVDTTGAGDAFVGAFAAGLASGWPPVDAARLGCAFAADSVTRPGTQASFAGPDAALAMMARVARVPS